MSTTASGNSGKVLILGVIAVAMVAAMASWSFRYEATHRVLEFWGPQAATLIRDAAHITLRSDAPSADGAGTEAADVPRDISRAKGITHLRNALLEDHSYDWTAKAPADIAWGNSLVFNMAENAEPRAVVLFSPDFQWAASGTSEDAGKKAVSTAPIAKGLQKFFADQSAATASE
jgi:hypothetical protein